MENVSKALLIAAAVLIVIILIGFGMIILNSTQDTVEDAQGVGSSISDASQTALGKIEDSFNKGGTIEPTQELISTETSYIGYYADIDGNGIVDGIIYADLAKEGSGQWGSISSINGEYEWDPKTNLNNYYISQESYQYKNFEKNAVIAPIDKVEEKDRFYVMALENFKTANYGDFYWYNNAYENMSEDITSEDFGKGKENTTTMMNKVYGGGLIDGDIWKHIGDEVLNGWFVPSRGEWGSFANELGITKTNYYKLRAW